jgi:hypothetical protein
MKKISDSSSTPSDSETNSRATANRIDCSASMP